MSLSLSKSLTKGGVHTNLDEHNVYEHMSGYLKFVTRLIISCSARIQLILHQDRGGVVLWAVGALAHPLALLGHQVRARILDVLATLGLERVGSTNKIPALVILKLFQHFDVILTKWFRLSLHQADALVLLTGVPLEKLPQFQISELEFVNCVSAADQDVIPVQEDDLEVVGVRLVPLKDLVIRVKAGLKEHLWSEVVLPA